MTYHDGKSLDREAEQVKLELAVACHGNTARDHEHNGDEAAVRLLNAERKGDQENSNGVESLPVLIQCGQ